MLSHASQKARIHRIMKDRKNLNAKPDKYSKLCISLTDEQDSELSAVVSKINKSQSMRSELDEVFLQADKDKEGHGAVLQDIWELDSADKQFSEDQQRNSCVCEVHVCVQILLIDVCISTNAHAPNPPPPPPPTPHPWTHTHSPTETGNRTNWWNLITYRLALAVYVRSPAVYEELKSFGVLQLPSKRSLQYFPSANAHTQGINKKSMSEQSNIYDAFCSQHQREGKKAPLHEGILIFDPVKVQSKVGAKFSDIHVCKHAIM